MPALKIFGTPNSRALRTIWMAGEAGLAYEMVEVDPHLPEGWPRDTSYGAINPNLRVPAIDDEGFRLWETMPSNERGGTAVLAQQAPQNAASALQRFGSEPASRRTADHVIVPVHREVDRRNPG